MNSPLKSTAYLFIHLYKNHKHFDVKQKQVNATKKCRIWSRTNTAFGLLPVTVCTGFDTNIQIYQSVFSMFRLFYLSTKHTKYLLKLLWIGSQNFQTEQHMHFMYRKCQACANPQKKACGCFMLFFWFQFV